jgi:hypothetical protein
LIILSARSFGPQVYFSKSDFEEDARAARGPAKSTFHRAPARSKLDRATAKSSLDRVGAMSSLDPTPAESSRIIFQARNQMESLDDKVAELREETKEILMRVVDLRLKIDFLRAQAFIAKAKSTVVLLQSASTLSALSFEPN